MAEGTTPPKPTVEERAAASLEMEAKSDAYIQHRDALTAQGVDLTEAEKRAYEAIGGDEYRARNLQLLETVSSGHPTLPEVTSKIEQNLIARGADPETAARLAREQGPASLERAQNLDNYQLHQQTEQQRLVGQGTDPTEAAARSHGSAAEKFGDLDMAGRAQAAESARVTNLDPERFRQMDLMVPESIRNDPVKWDSFERARLAEEARLHREMPQLSPEWQSATAHADALHLHGVKVPMLDGAGDHPRAAALADDALTQETERIRQHLVNTTGVGEEAAERIARQQAPEALARASERTEYQAAQADEAARTARASEQAAAAAAEEAARPARPMPISPDDKFQQLGQHQTVPRPEPGANLTGAADDAGRAAAAAVDSPLRTVGDVRTTLPPQVTQDGPLRSVGDPRAAAGQPEGARPATADTGGAPDPARRIDTSGTFDEGRTSPITTRESAAQAAADSAAADATRTHTFPDGTTASGMPDEHGKMQWFDNDSGDPLRSGANGEPVRPAAVDAPAASTNASGAADDAARAAGANTAETARPESDGGVSRPANGADSAAKPSAPAGEGQARPSAPTPENPRPNAPVGEGAPRSAAPSAPAAPAAGAPTAPAAGQPVGAGAPDSPRPVAPSSPAADPAGSRPVNPATSTAGAGDGATHLSSGSGDTAGQRVPDPGTSTASAANPAPEAHPHTPTGGSPTAPQTPAVDPVANASPTSTQPSSTAPTGEASVTDTANTPTADAPAASTNPAPQSGAPTPDAPTAANPGAPQPAPQAGNPAPDAPATSTSSTPGGPAQPDPAAHAGTPAPSTGAPSGGAPDAPVHPAGGGGAGGGTPAGGPNGPGAGGTGNGPGGPNGPDKGGPGASNGGTGSGPDKGAGGSGAGASGDAAKGGGKFSPKVGKTLTNLGVPPSAVRNITNGAPIKGVKGILKGQWNAGQHYAGKLGDKLGSKLAGTGLQGMGKTALKGAARFLPGVGMAVGGYFAYKAFKEGDYVGMVLNGLGMIPGPIGWIAMGAAVAWDFLKPHKTYGMWDAPDGTNTHILQGEAKDVSGVKESDASLRKAQAGVFSFQDGPTGTVWNENPPAALSLSAPEVVAEATAWLSGISDHFAAIDKAMTDSGEQYFSEQRQALAPHLQAMAKLKTQVKDLTDLLTASSTNAATGYQAVLDANKAARTQLSTDGTLNDQGPATIMVAALEKAQSAIAAADSKLDKLWAETPPAVVAARTDTNTGTKPVQTQAPLKPVTATPAAVTPAAQTPAAATPAKTETPAKNNDDLSKLLSQLGNKTQTPTSGSPLGSGSGLGGGSPLGAGTGGGTGGGTPLSSSKPDASEKSEPKKLGDDKKATERKTEEPKKLDDKPLSGAKPEQAKAAVPAEPKPAAAVPAAAPASTVPGTAAPGKPGAPAPEPSKEVDVKGQKTTFPDAKTAKLAQLLSQADPTHPVSLADAAAQAGLTPPVPGQDPGTQVNPAQAKPGDVMVAGDRQYMLLGDGKFYDLTDYKIVGASELPQNLGDRAGYFHLNDPNPGQAGAPVSGQTGGVQNAVPGATGANPLPTDASQNPGGAPGTPGSGANPGGAGGAQPPAGGAPSGGVPSTGTPGVPKPGGAGPANAASTETGTGQGGVSSGGQALDPAAVR